MSKNYISLERGGVKTGLKFDNGTIDHFGELVGVEDPITYQPESFTYTGLKKFAAIILRAALISNLEAKGQSPIVTEEEINIWMRELTPTDVYDLIQTWGDLVNPPQFRVVNGEVGKDTQPEISHMAAN